MLTQPAVMHANMANTGYLKLNKKDLVTVIQEETADKADQSQLNAKINLSGSRGQLAGYETSATLTSLTLTDTSADSNDYNSTNAITVNDGTAGMSWTKTVKLTQVPASVNMTGNWTWVGGSAPTLVVNGLLVFTWQNNHGLVNFLSPSA